LLENGMEWFRTAQETGISKQNLF